MYNSDVIGRQKKSFKPKQRKLYRCKAMMERILRKSTYHRKSPKGEVRDIILWQAPRAGSMQRILCSDWLPERARWSDTAHPGLHVSFPQIKFRQVQANARKFSFAEIIFCQGKKIFCVFSVFMQPAKASTRMKTKKTKMLMSFKNTFCNKNRQTQKFVLNLKI